MKTNHALLALLPVLLMACVVDQIAESAGARAEPGEDVSIGDPCSADACQGDTLAVCVDREVFELIDCSANRGACQRRGSRDECVPVGWECETRCLDENTLQICWSDLAVTTFPCDSGACDPDGALDPETGETSAVCLGPDPADCACDSFNTDPNQPLCCDAGCDCDVDCDTPQPMCGAPGEQDPGDGPGEGELYCPCDSYFSDPDEPMCCDAGCDCDFDCSDGAPACGGEDEDRGDPDVQAPDAWECDASYYDADDGCDCGCGVYDPDCLDPDQVVYGCQAGEICDDSGWCAAP